MEIVKRLLRAINFNYLLFAVAAVALLYILTTPFVLDALIAFVLAGVVPGTDIVLSPDTVLIMLGIASGVLVLAIITPMIIRRLLSGPVSDDEAIAHTITHAASMDSADKLSPLEQFRTAREIRRTTRVSAKAATVQTSRASTAISKAKGQLHHASTHAVDYPVVKLLQVAAIYGLWAVMTGVLWLASALSLFGRALLFGIGMILLTIKFLLIAMIEGAVQIGQLVWLALRLFVKYGTWAAVFVIVVIGVGVDALVRASKYTWTAAQPYLGKFDAWLELRYRAMESGVTKRAKRSDVLQVLTAIGKDAQRSLGLGKKRVDTDDNAEEHEYE